MISNIVVFDTSIFIDHLRSDKFNKQFRNLNALIRNTSVVLAELYRGVSTSEENNFISSLEKNYPILTPTDRNWVESGKILSKMKKDHGFSPAKIRDLHFDVLIALIGRNYGATVVTSNRKDFELIRSYKNFKLTVW